MTVLGIGDLSEEQYTFDLYEGHPAGETYHYHFNTPGPLEVLVDRGHSSSTAYRRCTAPENAALTMLRSFSAFCTILGIWFWTNMREAKTSWRRT